LLRGALPRSSRFREAKCTISLIIRQSSDTSHPTSSGWPGTRTHMTSGSRKASMAWRVRVSWTRIPFSFPFSTSIPMSTVRRRLDTSAACTVSVSFIGGRSGGACVESLLSRSRSGAALGPHTSSSVVSVAWVFLIFLAFGFVVSLLLHLHGCRCPLQVLSEWAEHRASLGKCLQ
jgi:hypothetical protein